MNTSQGHHTSKTKEPESIYLMVRHIPKGQVTTYGVIARLTGFHPRQVGYWLHHNPSNELTPCHRVISATGRVAKTFAFGGESMQKSMLELEGVTFLHTGRIDPKCILRFEQFESLLGEQSTNLANYNSDC